ncbi:MAG: universal stress protein [Chloroflexota bacterium]
MIQSILVPLDGSERAEQILPHAVNLAQKFDTTLVLVQVIIPVYHAASLEAPGYAQVILDDMKEMKRRASTYLKNHKLNLEKEEIEVNIRIEQGQPVERILAVAEEIDTDLIAMNSHGRTGLPRVLFGSVAAGVLHGTARPLYLIRSDLSES